MTLSGVVWSWASPAFSVKLSISSGLRCVAEHLQPSITPFHQQEPGASSELVLSPVLSWFDRWALSEPIAFPQAREPIQSQVLRHNTFHVSVHYRSTTCLFEVHQRHADRSIDRQTSTRVRSKSIKSSLLSNRSHSTPMPHTDRSVQRRSIPNKPNQTIYTGGRCVAIDVHFVYHRWNPGHPMWRCLLLFCLFFSKCKT